MNITYEIIGGLLQTLGVALVLLTQAFFVWKVRKKYGSLGTAFLEITATRVYMNPEDVKETVKNKQKLKEAFRKFPHAELLYDDFKYSLIGLFITLAGLIIATFGGSIDIQPLSHLVSVGLAIVCGVVSVSYCKYDIVVKSPEIPEGEHFKENWECDRNNCDLFKLQYEQISEGIRSRDSMTIVAGTILITASVLLLSASVTMPNQHHVLKIGLVLTSLAIYIIWLLCLNLTSNRLNNMRYEQLREMEKATDYKIFIQSSGLKHVEKKNWWKPIRRKIWLYLLWVLVVASIVIIEVPIN